SKLKSLWIQITRIADHIYRISVGLPARRRSSITPQLFVGGQYSGMGLNTLHRREFTAVVNLRLKSYEEITKQKGVRYLHLPTVDHQPSSMQNLFEGVRFITKEIESGGRVYVHCLFGEERGPSMAIACLISTGLTFED